MAETQTAWQTDRNKSEIRQMKDDQRAIWKIVQELDLPDYDAGVLVWVRRQGV